MPRARKAAGCKASLKSHPCRCHALSPLPMRPASRWKGGTRTAGQTAPGGLRVYLPKSLPLGRLHQNDLRKAKDPYSIQAARVSTDHSGASPVASALGIRLGATPRGRNYTNMHSQTATPKGDILTLLEKGTFSLCLDTRLHL